MKKITFLLTTAVFSTLFFNSGYADSYKYRPYIGIDYLYNTSKTNSASPHYHAGGIRIGSDYSKYFATELFFDQSNNDTHHFYGRTLKTSYHSFGLDILAFLPLGNTEKFSLGATTGIGEYSYRNKIDGHKHFNLHGRGYRFGGGAKYVLNDHWQVRVLVRYVNFDNIDNYDHATEYSAGIEYHF